MSGKHTLRGVVLALLAGAGWGFSGTVSQFLFSEKNIDTGLLTVIRMISAGVILLVIAAVRSPRSLKPVWKDRRSALRLVIFAVFGLMTVQFSYMQAIKFSNVGTATAIEYLGEALILLFTCASARRLPRLFELAGLILALAGVFLLATHGDISAMVLSPKGLIWALIAAFALALYTILPGKLIKQYGNQSVTGFGMLIGGAVLALILRPWTRPASFDLELILGMAAIIIIGTVFSFTAFYQSVIDLGGVKAGLLSSTETLFAPLFASLLLGTKFVPADCAGFACILAMVFLLAAPGLRGERLRAGAK